MKKVFRIPTTWHPNATSSQDGQIHMWLIAILTDIARHTARPDNPNFEGPTVDVIIEVLE